MTTPRQLPKWGELGPSSGFARDLLAVFGTDFTLPDTSSIRLILEPIPKSEDNTEWVEYTGYIPNDPAYLGTLAEEDTIRAGTTPYFVANLHREKNGWLVATLIQRDPDG